MSAVVELRAAIEKAINEDWELVKDTAGAVNSAAEIFPLAYRFGWHAARKHEGYVDAEERIRQLEKQCEVLAAEVDKMRPVVEATQRWRHTQERAKASENFRRQQEMIKTVDGYEAGYPK